MITMKGSLFQVAVSLFLLFENVSSQCSDSLLATFVEEMLAMKDTISSLQSTIALLEYRVEELESTESCGGSSTNAEEAGTVLKNQQNDKLTIDKMINKMNTPHKHRVYKK